MPLYEYCCGSCGHEDLEVKSMSFPALVGCPKCGHKAYQRQISLPHNIQDYRKPIEMFSIAMNTPEQVADFKRRAPDVDVSDDPRDPDFGLPIARNLTQKRQALKAVGYADTGTRG